MKILITGAAGFIGYHTAKRFLANGDHVVGIDNINDYYSIKLKEVRLSELGIDPSDIAYGQTTISATYPNFSFIQCDITDRVLLPEIFQTNHFDCIINLAAQAGVR